ncbi:MAG TPA: hypothetical protein VH280_24915, partial [Verrucomicrobiae bacterium]|nr:hypothetical protein [Verrucomicrobiae bacterium]
GIGTHSPPIVLSAIAAAATAEALAKLGHPHPRQSRKRLLAFGVGRSAFSVRRYSPSMSPGRSKPAIALPPQCRKAERRRVIVILSNDRFFTA